jgi:inositol transporter-like SP family MFS transporter
LRLVDRTSQRRLFSAGIALQVIGMLVLALFPLTTAVALGYVLFSGLGSGFGPQAFFALWSSESFPTTLRSTALGIVFAPANAGKSLDELHPIA